MGVGDINGIFGKAQQTSFNKLREGSAGTALTKQLGVTSSPVNTSTNPRPRLGRGVISTPEPQFKQSSTIRPVDKRAVINIEDLPDIESAESFDEQLAMLIMHLKAKSDNPTEIRTLIKSWVDVLLDEDSELRPESYSALHELTKTELIRIMSVLVSEFY